MLGSVIEIGPSGMTFAAKGIEEFARANITWRRISDIFQLNKDVRAIEG